MSDVPQKYDFKHVHLFSAGHSSSRIVFFSWLALNLKSNLLFEYLFFIG